MSKCVTTPSCWLMIVWPGAVMWHNEHQVSRDVTPTLTSSHSPPTPSLTHLRMWDFIIIFHGVYHFFTFSWLDVLQTGYYGPNLHISIVIKAGVCVAPGSAVAALRWPGLRYFVTMDRSFVLFNKVNTNDYQFNTNLPHFQHKILSSFSSA